jgi:hypothetical protein
MSVPSSEEKISSPVFAIVMIPEMIVIMVSAKEIKALLKG